MRITTCSDFCWRGRLNPNVQRAFASVWGVETRDLITSFDSGNVFRTWHEAGRPEWKTQGRWWHVDQNAAELICQCHACKEFSRTQTQPQQGVG